MVFIGGMLLGVFLGGGFCSFFILNAKKESMGVLADIQKSLLESDSASKKVLTTEEKLDAFNIKDTKYWDLSLNEIDRDYLLSEYLKTHNVVPYSKEINGREYLYPVMLFSVRLNEGGSLFYSHGLGSYRDNFYFNIPTSELKKLTDKVRPRYYKLQLDGGPYRVLGQFTNEYTEFDETFKATLQLPLESFSAQ